MKGDEIKGAFLLVLDKDNNIVDNEVIIHSGLIFVQTRILKTAQILIQNCTQSQITLFNI